MLKWKSTPQRRADLKIHVKILGVPVVVQQKRIWLGIMKLQVRSLASVIGISIIVSCRVGHRHGSDPVLLWHRPAATALIWPPARECLYAASMVLKSKNKQTTPPNKKQGFCKYLWKVFHILSFCGICCLEVLFLFPKTSYLNEA